MKLFHSALDPSKMVKTIRASTLASYYWCSIKSWLQASGIELPKTESMSVGTNIHNNIAQARMMSPQEKKFHELIKSYKCDEVISRPWIDNENIHIVADAEIVTHGYDGFTLDRKKGVTLSEYKTKKGWSIRATDVVPNKFQTQLYCWIMEPFLKMHGYHWKGARIIYVKRTREKDNNGNYLFVPIGQLDITDYKAKDVEAKIRRIFKEWDEASLCKTDEQKRSILLPPKRWKCIICERYSPEIYKICPFQQGEREMV